MTHDHRSLRRQAESQHAERIRRHAGGQADFREDKALVDREIKKAMHEHDSQLHPGKHTRIKLRDGGHIEGHAAARRHDRAGRRKKRDDGGMAGTDPATQAMTRAVDAGLAKNIAPAAQGQPATRKRGGRSPKGKAGHVNVIVATGAPHDRPVPVPVPAAGAAGPRPPMPPPGPPMMAGPGMPAPGMMPPGGRPPMMGGAPGMAMPMRARGGRARARGGNVADAAEAHGKGLAVSMSVGSRSAEGRMAKARMKTEHAAAAGD